MSKNKRFIYWCNKCCVPLIKSIKSDAHKCTDCKSNLSYLSRDIRLVFPEERLLFELIIGTPNKFIKESVWCNNSTYFINGKSYKITGDMWSKLDADNLRVGLEKHYGKITYKYFDRYIKRFIKANKAHFNYIRFEATDFIRNLVKEYSNTDKYISFSGGKDSTVVSDLVIKALSDPFILQIFCDTTLEYPYTLEYIKRLKQNNPKFPIRTIKNKEHDFYKLCDDIGVPSVSKRWCCTVFKSGISSKFLNQFFSGGKSNNLFRT